MYPVNGPEVILPFAQDKFDANGRLTDENTRKFFRQLLQNLVDWTIGCKISRQAFVETPTINTQLRSACVVYTDVASF